jgi:hypothetical protein
MSILDRLFKMKPSIELDDPVFRHITLDRGIWTFIPNPPTEGFMITVDAPDTGPTPEQRELFQQIRSQLGEFEQRARDYMRTRVDDGIDVSKLSTYSVAIGSVEDTGRREFVLELSDSDAIIIHCVAFRADEAVDYGFDD